MANPNYFDDPPTLARVIYRIFTGEQFDVMYDEFHKGHLEDTALPIRDYRRIVAGPGQSYFKRPLISVRFYGINTRVKPLDDPRLPQALAHAIDREVLVAEAVLGRYVVARGILPPRSQGFYTKL